MDITFFMNIHEILKDYFKDLQFDEHEHLYSVNGQNLTSVSHKIKDFVIPFDAIGNSKRIAEKRGVTYTEILQEWEDVSKQACELGTSVHLFGEHYNGSQRPTNGYEEGIVKYFSIFPKHIKLVYNELQMYSKEWGIAGTSDLILYNELTGKLIINDFKTNKDLFKNFAGQTLLHPFDDILDCPYGKYILQLSYYQLLLEQTGFEVESRCLVWLKPDGTVSYHKTPDVTDRLLNCLISENYK